MGDNRGQTIFLSVIGIATLLVTIVGATFAYFTTQVDAENTSGGSTSGTTAKIGDTTVKFEDETDAKYTELAYPGGIAMVGAKASITKDPDAEDSNDYKATYNIKITYDNPTNTAMEWKLYRIDSAVTKSEVKTIDCGLRTKVTESGATYLWYAQTGSVSEKDSCSLSEGLNSKLTDPLASGKFTAKTESTQTATVEELESNPLEGQTLSTKTNEDDYFYLVVKYPNTQENSADDQGKVVKFTLGVDSDSIKVDVDQTE